VEAPGFIRLGRKSAGAGTMDATNLKIQNAHAEHSTDFLHDLVFQAEIGMD